VRGRSREGPQSWGSCVATVAAAGVRLGPASVTCLRVPAGGRSGGVSWEEARAGWADDERTTDMGLMDSAKDALNSDKGEKGSDAGIDKAEQAASQKTGGKFDDKIDKAGEAADKKVGH
jgi:hypothetical protein